MENDKYRSGVKICFERYRVQKEVDRRLVSKKDNLKKKKKIEIQSKNAIYYIKLNRISYYKPLSETERLKKYNCVPWKIIVGLMREQWRLVCRASFWKFRTLGEQLMHDVFKVGTVVNLERYSFFKKIQNKCLCAYKAIMAAEWFFPLRSHCRPIQRSNVIEFATYSWLNIFFLSNDNLLINISRFYSHILSYTRMW